MLRAALIAALVFVVPAPAARQATAVLRITVSLVSAERVVTPVPRHVLLISDNPPSGPPRRVLTRPDGTAAVTLPPGNYTVESDRPVAFLGKAYEWRQDVDIAAGRDTVLELTADNAEVGAAASASTAQPMASADSDPSFLLTRWQDSVVTLWMPTTRASGFVVDARGLVVTSQQAIGAATRVEVQITPAVKVAAHVLVADSARDVAVLWIDREVVAAVRPVPLGCELAARPAVAKGQEIFTIGAPMRGRQDLTSGTVTLVAAQSIVTDFDLKPGGAGGPVFAGGGTVIGIASIVDDRNESTRDDTRVIRTDAACAVVAAAETKMQGASGPDRTRLPVEPMRPFPMDALRDAAARRGSIGNPYQLSSSDFDIALITPVLTYAAQNPSETPRPTSLPSQGNATRKPPVAPEFVRSLIDFGDWSKYAADFSAGAVDPRDA